MKKVFICLAMLLAPLAVLAGDKDGVDKKLHTAVIGFNDAYATNDVEAYFNYYSDEAAAFFFEERVDLPAYEVMWTAMISAGGGVEVNEISDLQIQTLPGGKTAIATYFVDNRTRDPEGNIETSKAFETDVWQKIDGDWKIIMIHYSTITAAE